MCAKTSFYSQEELKELGLGRFGKDVLVSRKASFYNPQEIKLGNHVRIDDFCILSGKVVIGSYVHIAAYCGLFARHSIALNDFSGLSSRVVIYTYSDDYLGRCMTNPTIPEEFRERADTGPVVLQKHVIVGSGSVILPNTLIKEGVSIGAFSLVKGTFEEWGIYTGNPARYRAARKSSEILRMEKELLRKYGI